jgi:adenylylsulfate kinase
VRPVEVLDGDSLRAALSPRLGFSRADRDEHVIRVGHLARLLARNGVLVLVAVIAPYAAARDEVRARHTEDGTPFLLVHVATSLAECRRRDTAGRYAAQAAGQLRGFTGVDDPYQRPVDPQLRLDTEGRSVAACRDEVLAMARAHGLW